MANYMDSEGNLRMKTEFGLLFALTLVLGATTVEANYTIAGGFTGTADYFEGARDFFRNSSALNVDRVVGSITLNATTAQPTPYIAGSGSYVTGYSGTADYSLSLYDLSGQLLLSYRGTGHDAYFNIYNLTGSKTTTTGFGVATAGGGTLGGNYFPSSFSVADFTTAPDRFQLAFQSVDGITGFIRGSFLSTTVAVTPGVTYTEPPLPTPVLPSLPLLASGLAGLGFLRTRKPS